MTNQDRDQIFVTIDDLYAARQAALDAEKRVAKMFVKTFLEAVSAEVEAHSKTTGNSDSLMTLQEVASYLKFSTRTIDGWIVHKGFPVRRCGDDPRFDRTEVDEWTKRHRKNNRALSAANGKVLPLQTRLQAKQGA